MENGFWQHINLAEIILGSVFGILFPALCVAAWRISSKTQKLESQHEQMRLAINEIDRETRTLLVLSGDFKRLDERCGVRCQAEQEARARDDAAHARIEMTIAAIDQKIEDAKRERHDEIEKLKSDLIREFYKSNGSKP